MVVENTVPDCLTRRRGTTTTVLLTDGATAVQGPAGGRTVGLQPPLGVPGAKWDLGEAGPQTSQGGEAGQGSPQFRRTVERGLAVTHIPVVARLEAVAGLVGVSR